MLYDHEIWPLIHVDDLWIYDKLILSKKLGYICGPAGVDLPCAGTYIVKPITNMLGMGLGSRFETFESLNTDHLLPGTFWMEVFQGDHWSVDLSCGQTTVIYQGMSQGTNRFLRWKKVHASIDHPQFIVDLSHRYGTINYEMIGGKIIEVHLRPNPDWEKYQAEELIPVWKGQCIPKDNFVEDADGDRLGFVVIKS